MAEGKDKFWNTASLGLSWCICWERSGGPIEGNNMGIGREANVLIFLLGLQGRQIHAFRLFLDFRENLGWFRAGVSFLMNIL